MPTPWEKYKPQDKGPWSKYETRQSQTLDPEQEGMQAKDSGFYSDLKGMAIGAPEAIARMIPGAQQYYQIKDAKADLDSIKTTGKTRQQLGDQSRKDAGYGLGYRMIAPVGEALGVNAKGMEQSAKEGDQMGVLGHAAAAAVPPVAGALGGEIVKPFAAAESNPNAVFHRYLDPVKHVPEEMPKTTPVMGKSLTTKVNINHPEVADRMRSGETNIGDLETARQVGNTSSKSSYSSIGKPTEMAEGYRNTANALRDKLYPKIEALHGLEPDTLRGIKKLEGTLIKMGPSPDPTLSRQGLALYLGDKYIRRPAVNAYVGARTKFADMNLPEPQQIDLRRNFPPPSGKLVKSIQPASVEIGGPQEVSGRPPQTSHTVAAPEHEPIRPALYEPPPNNAVHEIQAPPEGGARIAKVAPQTHPLPALPKEMLNLPPSILDEIEEMHRQGKLAPPKRKP